jgi:DNA-binding transcriptional ArsR family regulator
MKSEMRDCAANFSLLSDPTRLGILKILSKGPSTVTQLCKSLGMKQPLVSHHLGLLRMGRLVEGTRKGKSVIYVANKDVLKGMASCLRGLAKK